MKRSRELMSKKNSSVFILYKNKQQTLFRGINSVEVTENKIFLNRSPEKPLIIHMNSVEHYKIY